jgi:uncharacterized protein involved in outer membrane biogenesis
LWTFILLEENLDLNKPKRSIFSRMVRILLWSFLLLFFLIGSLIGLLFVYEDEVKAAIVTELNKHLKSEVKIDPKNIDLTIISTFPDCSIRFKDFLMLEALQVKKRDTLLFAGKLNLHFNIQNLWNKNYEIKKITLQNAVAKLRVLKNGKTNYTFWQESVTRDNGKKDSIRFNLKLISIENCRIHYRNKKNLLKTEIELKNLKLNGRFHDEDFELGSEATFNIKELVQEKTTFLKNKSCQYSVQLHVHDGTYSFKKADVLLNQMELKLSGKFQYKDSLKNLKLNYNAPNLDISSVLSLLPEKYKSVINDYESDGNFYAKGEISYKRENALSVTSDFGIKKGRITYKPVNTNAANVNITGNLKYTASYSSLDLKDVYLNLGNDEIKGMLTINNFADPHIQCSAQATVRLENLQNFWPIDTLTHLKGELKLNTRIEGLLKDLKSETFSSKVKIDLDANVSNLEAQFKGDEKLYAIEHCSVVAKEREIEISELKLKRGNSDLVINGKIPGMFNYIIDRSSPLIIHGSIFSENLRMEDFIPAKTTSSQANDNPLISPNLEFKLNAAILKFSFGKFEAQSITGEIEIKNQKAMVSDMKLQTLQGTAEIEAFADNSKKKLEVVLQSNVKDINVAELFRQMNNFGQNTLQDKNLKGVASASIEFSGSWNNRLEADPKAIDATCNVIINRGELMDFRPLLSLSKFVDVEDLKRIKFSSLQSNINIRNNIIAIPKTSIKNSALNIELWGKHTFNNEIDYHIQLLISELLAKKRKNKDSEFGPIEHDKENRRSAFILMTGTIDNPIIKYDRQGLKEKIKNDIKQEKQTIKQLLREEFGLFKRDSTLKKAKKTEETFDLERPETRESNKSFETKRKKEEEDDF